MQPLRKNRVIFTPVDQITVLLLTNRRHRISRGRVDEYGIDLFQWLDALDQRRRRRAIDQDEDFIRQRRYVFDTVGYFAYYLECV